MANFIPEDKIREVRTSADIVEVVSEHVVLKRAGKNYVGLCPFHAEKTPSFTVSPDKQIFYCFGCTEGGSVIDFMMKLDGLSFPETIRTLAGRYGVDIPLQSMSPAQRRQMTERESLLRVNREAAGFYGRCLMDRQQGERALAYLTRRGVTAETIRRYQLGYAPGGWDHFTKYLNRRKLPGQLAEKAGLIIPRKTGKGHYDRYRDRIVFPIFNMSQAIIGFGGRVMDNALPKYLNSPETPVYNKRRSLYGIDRARQAGRRAGSIFIVEGYFDLLALHQNGFTNAVATLGTSLTPEHVQIIRGLIGKNGHVVLVFDSDAAGVKAAKRSIDVFDRGRVDAHILVLPEGHDPDSFLLKFGADEFGRAASQAKEIVPFLLDSAVAEHGLTTGGKMRILSDLTAPLSAVGDRIARSLYVKEIAERLEIGERAILQKVMAGSEPVSRRESILPAGESRIERQIVSMMFQFPEILSDLDRAGAMDYFTNDALKAIGTEILKHKDRSPIHPIEISSRLADPDHARMVTVLALGDDAWHLEGCRRLVDRFVSSRRRQRDYRRIDQQIKEAEKNNDQEQLYRLLARKQKLAAGRDQSNLSVPHGS